MINYIYNFKSKTQLSDTWTSFICWWNWEKAWKRDGRLTFELCSFCQTALFRFRVSVGVMKLTIWHTHILFMPSLASCAVVKTEHGLSLTLVFHSWQSYFWLFPSSSTEILHLSIYPIQPEPSRRLNSMKKWYWSHYVKLIGVIGIIVLAVALNINLLPFHLGAIFISAILILIMQIVLSTPALQRGSFYFLLPFYQFLPFASYITVGTEQIWLTWHFESWVQ